MWCPDVNSLLCKLLFQLSAPALASLVLQASWEPSGLTRSQRLCGPVLRESLGVPGEARL